MKKLAISLLIVFVIGNIPLSSYAQEEWQFQTLKFYNQTFDIPYKITQGKVDRIWMDSQSASLLVKINTTDNGMLNIMVPRNLLNPNEDGNDIEFYVLVDGKDTAFNETKTPCARTLAIPFYQNSKEIELLGSVPMDIRFHTKSDVIPTYCNNIVVPEFPITVLILLLAIATMIAINRKFYRTQH